jgi:hypothetical protein
MESAGRVLDQLSPTITAGETASRALTEARLRDVSLMIAAIVETMSIFAAEGRAIHAADHANGTCFDPFSLCELSSKLLVAGV